MVPASLLRGLKQNQKLSNPISSCTSFFLVVVPLTGHYLVDMLPQSDLPLGEEHFVASGRQVIPLVEVANPEPGDIFGVAQKMSSTPRSCTFRWTPCRTTAEPPAFPLARLR